MKLKLTVLALFTFLTTTAQDTDSLLNQLTSDENKNTPKTIFKSTRIVLSHSTETQKKYDLDLRIRHHFGDIGGKFGNSHTLFGLDVASDLNIGLDYGITNRLTIGTGRSKHNETYYLFLKQKAIEQTASLPFSATFLVQAAWLTREELFADEFNSVSDRSSYFLQALIASKVSNKLSLEISPGYLIRSTVEDQEDEKGLFTTGIAGRFLISKRMALVADYQLVNLIRSDKLSTAHYNPLGVGLEIETGGHIFSLNFMNSEYILENNFLPSTTKSWNKGGVRFGFTISRNFTLHRSKNPDINSKIY